MTTRAIISDIDGTIADNNHRLHLILDSDARGEKQWTKFFEHGHSDIKINSINKLLIIFKNAGYDIWLFTARPEWTRGQTEHWLKEMGIPYDVLKMRHDHDYRHDAEVKKDMALGQDLSKVDFVIEDRKSCVQMFRNLGLCCLQCADGDY